MTNQMTEKEALAIDSMLRKIAYKKRYQYASSSSRIDVDDVVQELWIKAMDIWDRCPTLDFDAKKRMIAKAAFDKIVDIVRAQICRPSVGIDPSTLEWNDDSESNSAYTYLSEIAGFSSRYASPSECAEIEDILNMFEEGSKARQMLELLVEIQCNLPGRKSSGTDFSDLYGQGDQFDSWIAKKLGWKGSCSCSYQKLKNQVMAKLIQSGYAKGYTKAEERLTRLGYVLE